MTNPNTAEVWAEHAIWPQDPQFELALAGGVTAMQHPAGLRQPVRRARRHREERAGAHGRRG